MRCIDKIFSQGEDALAFDSTAYVYECTDSIRSNALHLDVLAKDCEKGDTLISYTVVKGGIEGVMRLYPKAVPMKVTIIYQKI